jgi:uncharacterized protein
LEPFELPLSIDFTELYAFNKRSVTDSGLLVPDDGYIDLAPLVREYLLLDFPINPVCKPDCLGLCTVCGNNLNETKCDHGDQDIDPRFAVLKDLLEDED